MIASAAAPHAWSATTREAPSGHACGVVDVAGPALDGNARAEPPARWLAVTRAWRRAPASSPSRGGRAARAPASPPAAPRTTSRPPRRRRTSSSRRETRRPRRGNLAEHRAQLLRLAPVLVTQRGALGGNVQGIEPPLDLAETPMVIGARRRQLPGPKRSMRHCSPTQPTSPPAGSGEYNRAARHRPVSRRRRSAPGLASPGRAPRETTWTWCCC